MQITIPHNYEPRPYQLPILSALDGGKKRGVCVWHRRSGKDKTFLNYLVKKMFQRVGIYYYFFPNYNQGRKILWDGIDRAGFAYMSHIPVKLRKKTNIQEMKVTLCNNSIFQIVGTDNIDSIMGTNPVGCVFSEYSLQDPQAWDFIRPILLENDGWAIFNYTPRGRNHGYKLYEMAKHNPDWFCELLTVEDTGDIITQDMLQAEREAGMDEQLLQQEYYCSFDAALQLCFFGDSLSRHKDTMAGVRYTLQKNKGGDIDLIEDNKGIVTVWRYPYSLLKGWDELHWSLRYCIGSDIAEGLQQDYSVAYVYDRVKHEIVCRVRSNRMDSYAWGKLLKNLSQYYGNAYIVPERTGAGITVCKYLFDQGANVYTQEVPAKVGAGFTKTVGFVQQTQAKYDICGDLKEYFISTKGNVYCSKLLEECATFIRMEGTAGRLGADEGFHDDCVIAGALAIHGNYVLEQPTKEIADTEFEWGKRLKKQGESNWAI